MNEKGMSREDKKQLMERMAKEAKRELDAIAHPSAKTRIKQGMKRILGRGTSAGDLLFWPAGLLLLGLVEAGYTAEAEGYLEHWFDRGMLVQNPDDALAGAVMIRLWKKTGKECYRNGVQKIRRYLASCRKDPEGAIVYGQRSSNNWIYADGAGQIGMFLSEISEVYGEGSGWEEKTSVPRDSQNENSCTGMDHLEGTKGSSGGEEAWHQLELFWKRGLDERSGLPYHGYDAASGMKYGIIGWGRAVGWLLLGVSALRNAETKQANRKKRETELPGSKSREKAEAELSGTKSREKAEAELSGAEYRETPAAAFGKTAFADFASTRDKDEQDSFWETAERMCAAVRERIRSDGLFSWQLDCLDGPADTSASGMIYYSLLRMDLAESDLAEDVPAEGVPAESDSAESGEGILRKEEPALSNEPEAGCSSDKDARKKSSKIKQCHMEQYEKAAAALYALVDENGKVTGSSAECVDFAQYRQQYGNNPWGQGAVLAFLALYERVRDGLAATESAREENGVNS